MKVMKPKVCLFVRAGLYRGSRGFWKRPYGRPEGPNRYGTLAKLKAMFEERSSREPCRDLWCGSGEDKEQGREPSGAAVGKISRGNGGGEGGGAATAKESAVAKTSQARRRRSQARVREGGRQRGGALWHSATEAARERWQELVQFSSVAI